MRFKEIIKNYLRFQEVIARLGALSLMDNVVLEKVEPSKGDIQAIYKQIKEDDFKGSAIDYLCYVSMLFVQSSWISGIDVVIKRRVGDIIHLGNYEFKLRFFLQELFETCLRDEGNARNMLRIFHKNPALFFDSDPYREFLSNFQGVNEDDLKTLCFNVVNAIYYCLSFGSKEEQISEVFEASIKGMKKIALAPMYLARSKEAEGKTALKLLPREAKVLDAIVDYLAKIGGSNKISSIKRTLSEYFISKKVIISEATIFHAVRGLTEVGLLRVTTVERSGSGKRYTYELDRKMLGSVKIRIWHSLIRQTLSPSIRPAKKEKKSKKKLPMRRRKKEKILGLE